ncbi:MAG: hypothetical protein F6J86_27555 [Symploca sp. SIO1B1]|nr:hypothetical protein [Symploca sp. SIO1B1]
MATKTTETVSVVDKPEVEWQKDVNKYSIRVEKEGEYFFPTLWEKDQIIWSGGVVGSFSKAKNTAILAHNRHTQVFYTEGLAQVDVELLVKLPYNEIIYSGNSSNVKRLIGNLSKSDSQLVPLVADQWGVIIDGNSRHEAVSQINEALEAKNEPKKYKRVPVNICFFKDDISRLKRLKLMNSYRVKSEVQLLNEARLALKIEEVEAAKRERAGVKSEGESGYKGRSIYKVSQKLDRGVASLRYGITALDAVEKVREKSPQLAEKWCKLIEDAPNKVAMDITSIPEEDREAVIDNLYDNGIYRKGVSVKRAYKEVENRRELEKTAQQQEESGELSSDPELQKAQRIRIQQQHNDKPSDNWYSPDDIVQLIVDTLGEIDLDPFADLTKRIPAKQHYTIIDDGLAPDNPWKGRIFANILYSDQYKCLSKASAEITKGHTTVGIYLCESGALFNKRTQNIIDKHGMSICAWKGRIEFIPGELLLENQPNAGSSSRINSVFLFYAEDESLKRHFEEIFSPYGKIYHDTSYLLSTESSNEGDITSAIRKIKWEKGKASFLGAELTIGQLEDTLWSATAGSDSIDAIPNEREAKATAIALAIESILEENPFAIEESAVGIEN